MGACNNERDDREHSKRYLYMPDKNKTKNMSNGSRHGNRHEKRKPAALIGRTAKRCKGQLRRHLKANRAANSSLKYATPRLKSKGANLKTARASRNQGRETTPRRILGLSSKPFLLQTGKHFMLSKQYPRRVRFHNPFSQPQEKDNPLNDPKKGLSKNTGTPQSSVTSALLGQSPRFPASLGAQKKAPKSHGNMGIRL